MADKPYMGRMLYYTYNEYIDKWDEIKNIFSKDSVLRGEPDRKIITHYL